MNIFLALFLLVNLALAHLPHSPVSLRRSAAHKRRLDASHLSPGVVLRRRSLLNDLVAVGDTILGATSPADSAPPSSSDTPPPPSSTPTPPPSSNTQTPTPSSDTPTPSPPSDTPTPTSSPDTPTSTPSSDASTPTPSSGTPTLSSTSPDPSSSDSVPSSSPSPSPSDSTPSPSPSSSDPTDCGLLGLGVLCSPSSSPTPSSTDVSPPPSTSDPQSSQSPSSTDASPPPSTSDPPQSSQPPPSTSVSSDQPPSQTSQPPSITDLPLSITGDLCSLLGSGCPSSTPVSSDLGSTPPASPTPSTPVSSDTASNPPPSQASPPPSTTDTTLPSTTIDLCASFGIGCLPSSTPFSDSPSSQTSQPPSTADTPPSTTDTPLSTIGDLCILSGIGCPSSSTPTNSDTIPPTISSQSPPVSSSAVDTNQALPSSTGDLCLLFGVGCPPSSTPGSSDLVSTPFSPVSTPESTQPSFTTPPPSSETSSEPTQFPSSEPPSTTGVSSPPGSSVSSPSDTLVSFPSGTLSLPSSSTPDSVLTPPSSTSPPLPSNTEFQWLTQSSLIFSSLSESASNPISLTDPDQVPTSTLFSTTRSPTAAPSVISLPSGIPARIVPGDGSANPGADDLNGFTLIAILFDQGLNWDTVVQNTDSPGQIFAWLPELIKTALSITNDQVKSFALQVYVPGSYQGPQDVSRLGTTWLGYIPATLVESLAAQIKVKASSFYTALPPPYSDLAAHVDPTFDIMTVTTTTGIPGSGGPSSGSSSGASSESHTRENAIIGVVSALGGITLIVLGYLVYRAVQKRRELAHQRLTDPPTNPFVGEAPPNRTFDQDSIGGQRRRSFYFAEDSLRGFSDYNHANEGARRSPEHTSGLNRRPIAGNIGPPVMRENSLNF